MNVTATNADEVGYLTVWPAGEPMPEASSLNFIPSNTVPNLTLAKLGRDGRLSIACSAGTLDVIGDAAGWFPASNGYRPLTPARVLDSRRGLNIAMRKVGPAETIRLTLAGRGGVPSSGADAVVLNLTASELSSISYITVYPSGAERPNASNLNLRPQHTVPNLVIAKLSDAGAIDIFNASGETNVIADVVGYFPHDTGHHPLQPARILDTRVAIGARGKLGPRVAVDVDASCHGGVPANATAVVLNVTVAEPDAAGYVSVWPTGDA